jgi:hypothetical protein
MRLFQSLDQLLRLKTDLWQELLGRKSSDSCLESQEHGLRDPSRWPRDTLYPQKLALTSPTNGCRPVGIVRSQTKATELLVSYDNVTSCERVIIIWASADWSFEVCSAAWYYP